MELYKIIIYMQGSFGEECVITQRECVITQRLCFDSIVFDRFL